MQKPSDKKIILAVDDEPYITTLVERVLVDAGYEVVTTNDATSSVALFEKTKPDLVILDIRMPGLDGYQVLSRIREISDVPVLMLTAVRDQNSIAQSLGLGADDYIEKPFMPRVLVAHIQAKLRRTWLSTHNADGKENHSSS